jgi:putative hydrolase of the HAD superfamily
MITHVYFDWSATLAKSRSAKTKQTMKKYRCKILYPDVKLMCKYLYEAGYTIGMITNSLRDVSYLVGCLSKYDILKYMKGAILVASMDGMKEKPAPILFKTALEMDGAKPENALMVGNDYKKDILGAKKVGMKTAFVDRLNEGPKGIEDIYIKNILELGLYL